MSFPVILANVLASTTTQIFELPDVLGKGLRRSILHQAKGHGSMDEKC